MPVRLRGTKLDLDAIRLCSFCSYLQKLSRRSLLSAIVSSWRLQYLGDAENGCCATWNRGEKRGQLNERLECLWSGLISHEPLDYGRIYRIVLSEKRYASTKKRLPQKGRPFWDTFNDTPSDPVETVLWSMICLEQLLLMKYQSASTNFSRVRHFKKKTKKLRNICDIIVKK